MQRIVHGKGASNITYSTVCFQSFDVCRLFYPVSSTKWSALVNIRRKALLSLVGFRKRMTSCSLRSLIRWFICTSIVYIRLVRFLVRDFVPLFRSFLDWFQSIQTRRCHCLRFKGVLMFQASSYSEGKRTFVVHNSKTHTVQKDSREVLGTSFPFGPTSEILENIQYGGSSMVENWQPQEFFRQRSVILRYCWLSLRLLWLLKSSWSCIVSNPFRNVLSICLVPLAGITEKK